MGLFSNPLNRSGDGQWAQRTRPERRLAGDGYLENADSKLGEKSVVPWGQTQRRRENTGGTRSCALPNLYSRATLAADYRNWGTRRSASLRASAASPRCELCAFYLLLVCLRAGHAAKTFGKITLCNSPMSPGLR